MRGCGAGTSLVVMARWIGILKLAMRASVPVEPLSLELSQIRSLAQARVPDMFFEIRFLCKSPQTFCLGVF